MSTAEYPPIDFKAIYAHQLSRISHAWKVKNNIKQDGDVYTLFLQLSEELGCDVDKLIGKATVTRRRDLATLVEKGK